ncbi:putative proline racemase [Exophiala viscosa]|uniref:putative proline racemase n=1 Tax=Exophiala viscosa TaxID=2486360 RepID=UPI0021A04A8E|nr:putative proline racemase [Exophiala viscosa]
MDGLKEIIGDVALREPIKCVDMHTTGEPTRIIYSGYPNLTGTLLEQRAQALTEYDHIRKRLMFEPRGHWDMYGAILRPDTELVASGKADMGVLFTHNEGYSTMCGHATIALGRFLVDADESIFPRGKKLRYDKDISSFHLSLHVPSGPLEVTVPALPNGKSDPSRPVSFLSVPSFATGVSVKIPLSPEYRWPELGDRTFITADFSYGGAFYCIVDAEELGFSGRLADVELGKMDHASKQLKAAVNANPDLSFRTKHPITKEMSYLYSIMIVDTSLRAGHGSEENDTSGPDHAGEETGLCFFANQQIDRSPTGGAVAARVALAYNQGKLSVGQRRTYHSLLSQRTGMGGFTGSVIEALPSSSEQPHVRVRVEGSAHYTGMFTAVVEEKDGLGRTGFALHQLEGCQR